MTCVMGNKPFLMVITCRIPFMQRSRNDRTVELETRLVVAGGYGGNGGGREVGVAIKGILVAREILWTLNVSVFMFCL